MTNQQKALITVLTLGAIGGSIGTFVKVGVQIIPPFTFTFLRFFIAALCILPFLFNELKKHTLQTFTKPVGVTLLAVGKVALFAYGVQYTTAIIASLLYVTSPVMVAVLSYFFLHERFSRRKITGILLGIIGVAILILLPVISRGTQFSGTLFGNLTVFTAVTCYALYTVFSKKYQTAYSPRLMTFIFAVTASVVLFPIAARDWSVFSGWVSQLNWLTVFSVGYVGIIGGAIFYLLYQKSIQKNTPLIASVNQFIQPVFTYLTALFFLNEKLIPGVVAGAVIAIAGAWLVATDSNKVKTLNNARTP